MGPMRISQTKGTVDVNLGAQRLYAIYNNARCTSWTGLEYKKIKTCTRKSMPAIPEGLVTIKACFVD